MRSFAAILVTLSVLVALAFAATENVFTSPTAGTVVKVGEVFTIEWIPNGTEPVSLELRKGLSTDLKLVSAIACECTSKVPVP